MWHDPATGQQRGGVAKVNYTHERMADIILANPAVTQNELALHFGYTAGWISQVIASDSFQVFVAERKDKILDPLLRGAVEESMKGLVNQSIARLREKLDANPSDQLALEVLKNSTRALGYGARLEVHGSIQHTHGLIGILAGMSSEKVVVPELLPAPAQT